MIRRFKTIRPMLIFAFALFWTFHFSFGMFTHYHPDYVHAHDGELQTHAHGGHFHSLELDTLARLIEPDELPLRPRETHHHSESVPGSDTESVQYDLNQSGVTKLKLTLEFHPVTMPIPFTPWELEHSHFQKISYDPNRIFLLPQSHSERSPPLRV